MRFNVRTTFLFLLAIIIVLNACRSKEANYPQVSGEAEQIDNDRKANEKKGIGQDQKNETTPDNINFFNEIKSNLPYTFKSSEERSHFDPDQPDAVDLVHRGKNFTLVSYSYSFASEAHEVIATYDNASGTLLHKIDIDDGVSVKMESPKDSALIIRVQVNFPTIQVADSEFYLKEVDIQFYEVQENGVITIINWGPDQSELTNLSNAQLRLIRNRVFAKYGYIFEADDLRYYFLRFNWYKPVSSNVTNQLTSEDKKFLEYVLSLEK